MYKLSFLMALLLSGCANFTINATMCDQIASDPHAVMPEECRDYDETKAQKAFDKTRDEKKTLDKDLEVNQEK